MQDPLQIVIPSRSRFTKQTTLHNLSQNLWPYITLVVPRDQYESYRMVSPMEVTILGFDGNGIGAKREYILHMKHVGKLIMLDDDLRFYKRTEDGTKFPPATPEQTELMIDAISGLLNIYPYVGLTDKFMSQTKRRLYDTCQRFNQVLAFNRDTLPKPWPQFRLNNDEEHDVHLQLLTRGYRSGVLTEWSKSDKPNAPGGCHDWRDENTLPEAHMKLTEFWPNLVTIDRSKEQPRARYNWQEAKKMGGILVDYSI